MQLDLVGPMFKRSRSQLWSGVKFRTFLTENAQQHTQGIHTYVHTDTHTSGRALGGCPYVVIMLSIHPQDFSLSPVVSF